MPVATVFENLEGGASIEDIVGCSMSAANRSLRAGIRARSGSAATIRLMLVLFDHGYSSPDSAPFSKAIWSREPRHGWDRLTNGELLDAAERTGFRSALDDNKNNSVPSRFNGP